MKLLAAPSPINIFLQNLKHKKGYNNIQLLEVCYFLGLSKSEIIHFFCSTQINLGLDLEKSQLPEVIPSYLFNMDILINECNHISLRHEHGIVLDIYFDTQKIKKPLLIYKPEPHPNCIYSDFIDYVGLVGYTLFTELRYSNHFAGSNRTFGNYIITIDHIDLVLNNR